MIGAFQTHVAAHPIIWIIMARLGKQAIATPPATQHPRQQIARHTRKSKSNPKDGFRGHLAAEPEIGLITDAEVTKAAGD